MRPKTKEMMVLLGVPAAICALLTVLLFLMVVVAGAAVAATTTVLTDAPCTYAAGTLDCRATQPPVPPIPPVPPVPPEPPTTGCNAFNPVIRHVWDWSQGGKTIDTAFSGRLGQSGIIVIEFVATPPFDKDNLAFADAIGYPSPNQGNVMTLSLSTKPCDLAAPDPATSVSYAPTVTYGVGSVPTNWWNGKPQAVALTPGTRYYINVAGRNAGVETCQPAAFGTCEARIALRVPTGH